jgi:hypothetical protein
MPGEPPWVPRYIAFQLPIDNLTLQMEVGVRSTDKSDKEIDGDLEERGELLGLLLTDGTLAAQGF